MLKNLILVLLSLSILFLASNCDRHSESQLLPLTGIDSTQLTQWITYIDKDQNYIVQITETEGITMVYAGNRTALKPDYLRRALTQIGRLQGELILNTVSVQTRDTTNLINPKKIVLQSKTGKTDTIYIGKEFFRGEKQIITYYCTSSHNKGLFLLSLPITGGLMANPIDLSAERIDQLKLPDVRTVNMYPVNDKAYEIIKEGNIFLVDGVPGNINKLNEMISIIESLKFVEDKTPTKTGASFRINIISKQEQISLNAFKINSEEWAISKNNSTTTFATISNQIAAKLFVNKNYFLN